MSENRLRCRWCTYSTLAWRTQKNGRRRSGWDNLVMHVWDNHETEPEAAAFIGRVIDGGDSLLAQEVMGRVRGPA